MLLIILLSIDTYAYVHKEEQYMMDVYNRMNSIKEFLTQMDYYTALEKLEKRSIENLQFQEESLTIYTEHYQELLKQLKVQQVCHKNEKEDMKMFLRETFPEVIDKIKRIITDKEKLIEGDIKELAKIKHSQSEDFIKRFEEFNYLHQKIQEVLQSNDQQDIYKALELLESKIMIGSFKQLQSQEVDFFMKSVDRLFREKQNVNKKEESIQLLSLMRSIISEYLITTMNDKLEQSFDLLEKEIFYTQSKNTHINAKEQYVNLLQRLEQNHFNIWKNIIDIQLDSSMMEIGVKQQEIANKIGNHAVQYHLSMQEMVKAMLERFLQR